MKSIIANIYKCIEDRYGILSLLGLFIQVPISNCTSIFKKSKYGWVFTLSIGKVPLGWIIVVIDLIIKYLI